MSQQIRERQLRVLSPPTVHYVFGDERTQSQTLIQLAHQKQTTVGGDARTLEIHFQMGVKRELKWLILFLTDWIEPPQSSFYSQSRMNTGVGAIIQPLTQSSKRKFGIKPESCGPGCSSSGPLKLAFGSFSLGSSSQSEGVSIVSAVLHFIQRAFGSCCVSLSTLINCGSSSRLLRRKKAPTGVRVHDNATGQFSQ